MWASPPGAQSALRRPALEEARRWLHCVDDPIGKLAPWVDDGGALPATCAAAPRCNGAARCQGEHAMSVGGTLAG